MCGKIIIKENYQSVGHHVFFIPSEKMRRVIDAVDALNATIN
jgi:hypothetical protein